MPGEFDHIAWVRRRTPPHPAVLVGPGDDCAVLARPAGPLLVTSDMLTDGVDFVLGEVDPRRVGRKAMAVNLSDIAAMAGVPTAAVVSVALPSRASGGRQSPGEDAGPGEDAQHQGADAPRSPSLAESLYLGLRDVADRFGVPVVGGDTNGWDGPLVISVTALGTATGRGPVRRDGAKPGDWLFVTGPCGGSLLGHHLDFTPRVTEALALHAAADLHAMIDVSDGLAADLAHILDESGCGAVLVAEAVPIAAAAHERSRQTGRPPLAHALGDGEDFELVFAVSPADGERLLREQPVPGLTLAKIGECVPAGLWLDEGGVRRPLEPTGWKHAIG
jgi:thiamine-monophosphate kinase